MLAVLVARLDDANVLRIPKDGTALLLRSFIVRVWPNKELHK
jgi:hypothetical protein